MAKDVIIALDYPDGKTALEFLKRFGDKRPYVKVGVELFYSAGAELVGTLRERGHEVFLDLKLCDIPNTVCRAMSALSKLGASMVNVHALGGSEMMRAAREGLGESPNRPILIAVTVLTSMEEKTLAEEILIDRGVEDTVAHFSRLAAKSGLDGIVCSPHEVGWVKSECGQGFLTVTPGIRFANCGADDQKRIASPKMARALGADYIVVGRPITGSHDPAAEYDRCVGEFLKEGVE